MKKRFIVLLVILGVIVLFVILLFAIPSPEERSDVKKEYQGDYHGLRAYENQTITVTSGSISGDLSIDRVFLRIHKELINIELVIDDGNEKITLAYIYRFTKGPDTEMIGLIVDTVTEKINYQMIAFGKDAVMLAQTLQKTIESKADTLGSYKAGSLSGTIRTNYDETFNWMGIKQ
jgi:hypothetical protein